MPLNVEIKARSTQIKIVRRLLENQVARFVGVDHQIDTYFKVAQGRLKLRQGNIENALIHYSRSNEAGPKKSEVLLYQSPTTANLKEVLDAALEKLVVVDKMREIYFIDNVKFHLDKVDGLGTFVEIEAIDQDGTIGEEKLQEQCNYYLQLFQIPESDLVPYSYSDLLLGKGK
ncbi:MAG: class IV adenylate cyclase [Saprospiraceae bacterium]|nr:class IV adenylate cyclase [Saprospiraceae bacterium]